MRNIDSSCDRPSRDPRRLGLLGAALVLAAAGAQAQSQPPPVGTPATDDHALTWHGITLYGIVDIGLQYDTHSAPFSDYFMAGSGDVVQKNSNDNVFGVTSNNLSQSRIGLQGVEPLHYLDWSGVFKLETFFNPASGEISDALKSLVQNNGKALSDQTIGIDSSVAGQAFQQSFAGLSSPTYGTITFGRQNTLFADAVSKYDPNAASQAFSVIGLSGTAAGAGNTEDRRLDDSLKYNGRFMDLLHVGVQYKFQNSTAATYPTGGSGEAFNALELQLGGDYAGLSVDGYYIKIKDAVSASSLSADQFTGLAATGYSASNSLAGTISDTETWALAGLYNFGGPTVYAAYEHISYSDPSIPLAPGFNTEGGYVLAFVNNTAFPRDKVLKVYWAGVKYPVTEEFNVTLAYYGYWQNSYGVDKDAGCSTAAKAATCSGNLSAAALAGDYRFTKRFDAYAGFMWSNVSGGLANGYLNNTNINPTIGVRYSF